MWFHNLRKRGIDVHNVWRKYTDSWLTIPGEGDIGALNQRSRVNDLVHSHVPSYLHLRTFVPSKVKSIMDRGSLVTALIYIGHRAEILEVLNTVT